MSSDLSLLSFIGLLAALGSVPLYIVLLITKSIRGAGYYLIATAFTVLTPPLMVPAMIASHKSHSYGETLWMILLMMLGATVVSIITVALGSTLLKFSHSIPSDCGGLSYVLIVLPFFIYIGWVVGAFLVALYWQSTWLPML